MTFDLSEGWRATTLAEIIADAQPGFASGKKDVAGGLPHLRMNNIGVDGRLDLRLVRTVPRELSKRQHELETGDILVCTTNSGKLVGKCALFNLSGQYAFSNHLTRLRPRPNLVDAAFLLWFLWLTWKSGYYIDKCKHWVNQSTLPRDELLNTPVILPPISEQRRIVVKLDELLRKVEECKERLSRMPNLIKRFRRSVLNEAANGRLTEDWRARHAVHEGAAREIVEGIAKERASSARNAKQKAVFLPISKMDLEVPESWTWASPSQLRDLDTHSLSIGPFGSDLKVSDYQDEGIPLVFVRNIRSETFGQGTTKFVSKEKAEQLKAHQVMPGDLLITKMGEPPGDACLYPLGQPRAIITADCIRFRPHPLLWDSREFLTHAINSDVVKSQMTEITKGVAQQKISLERFSSLAIPLPPIEEQLEIIRRIESLWTLVDSTEQRIHLEFGRIDQLSQAILAKAFCGELVHAEANDLSINGLDDRD